mmetsp:Transcript_6289/g.19696  ORF Transcript_6289/g.19696 Transcript_6289/m.19696 type:complete len:279 (+) Transcript_6289:558-1394(+)
MEARRGRRPPRAERVGRRRRRNVQGLPRQVRRRDADVLAGARAVFATGGAGRIFVRRNEEMSSEAARARHREETAETALQTRARLCCGPPRRTGRQKSRRTRLRRRVRLRRGRHALHGAVARFERERLPPSLPRRRQASGRRLPRHAGRAIVRRQGRGTRRQKESPQVQAHGRAENPQAQKARRLQLRRPARRHAPPQGLRQHAGLLQLRHRPPLHPLRLLRRPRRRRRHGQHLRRHPLPPPPTQIHPRPRRLAIASSFLSSSSPRSVWVLGVVVVDR